MAESVASNLRYGGKVAIVSGGSKGIGEGIVREFGKQIENQQHPVVLKGCECFFFYRLLQYRINVN